MCVTPKQNKICEFNIFCTPLSFFLHPRLRTTEKVQRERIERENREREQREKTERENREREQRERTDLIKSLTVLCKIDNLNYKKKKHLCDKN
jgi:hypothetical protein